VLSNPGVRCFWLFARPNTPQRLFALCLRSAYRPGRATFKSLAGTRTNGPSQREAAMRDAPKHQHINETGNIWDRP